MLAGGNTARSEWGIDGGGMCKAAASGAMLAVFLVIEAVAFVPALQVKWALTRMEG